MTNLPPPVVMGGRRLSGSEICHLWYSDSNLLTKPASQESRLQVTLRPCVLDLGWNGRLIQSVRSWNWTWLCPSIDGHGPCYWRVIGEGLFNVNFFKLLLCKSPRVSYWQTGLECTCFTIHDSYILHRNHR